MTSSTLSKGQIQIALKDIFYWKGVFDKMVDGNKSEKLNQGR